MSTRLLQAVLFLAGVLLAPPGASADVHEIETEHYRLQFEGARSDAEEASRVLEAAWRGFRDFFGAEPKLKPGAKLRVRFYASREAWARGILADGTRPPASAGGYYWPPSKTAHLYRQPTQYFTRVLLVHEAAHQFHYLARTRNRKPAAGWYIEGVAEFLSWHRWDGTRLELGVVPGVSLKDYPAAASKEIGDDAFDLAAVVGGKVHASRPVAWALFSFLASGGKDGKPLPRFRRFLRKMDAGGQPWPVFKAAFGRAARLHPRILEWLREHQTPWAQVFNEWEQVAVGAFRGHAGVVTAARLKQPAKTVSAVFDLPPAKRRWRAGLLLHWTSNDDYTVALVTARGSVHVDRRVDGRWQRLHRGRLGAARAESRRLRATRAGGGVAFFVDGQKIGAWELPGRVLGLALDNGDLRFREVAWD